MDEKDALVVFQDKDIRRTWHGDEWWFVIKDVVFALTDSKNPSEYLKKMRRRDDSLNEAFKGGDNLYPPLVLSSKQQEVLKCFNHGIQKEYFVLFNQFLLQKQSRLSNGLHKLVMSGYKKYKILNLHKNA